MRRILILRGGALGDFLVTLPALARLRESWPDAVIELAGNAPAGVLAKARGLLDAVHSQHEARWAGLFGDGALPGGFDRWLEQFDLVINFWPDPDHLLGRRFPLRMAQAFITSPPLPERAPAAAHYCAALASLGIAPGSLFFPLDPLPARMGSDEAPRATMGSRIRVAVHPGSGAARKNWPLEHWEELCAALTRRHESCEFLIVTGEADRPEALASRGRLLRNRPLEELVAEFRCCRLFLGHDSGISHLAAACGVPAVLLFGPTDPAIWAPPVPHVTVVRRGPEMAALTITDVLAALPVF